MQKELILPILYEMSLIIGRARSLQPLLTQTLQRLLYHTAFPVGFVALDLPSLDTHSEASLLVKIDNVIGDFDLMSWTGKAIALPSALVFGPGVVKTEQQTLLAQLPCKQQYQVFMRLPIQDCGVIILLAPTHPNNDLPFTQMLQPVMANLANAIKLCRQNDAYTSGLIQAREQVEEHHRVIFNATNDTIILLSELGSILEINQVGLDRLGYRKEELVGKHINCLDTADHCPTLFSSLQEIRALGEKTFETTYQPKSGLSIPVEINAKYLLLHNEPVYLASIRDITERLKTRNQLEAQSLALRHSLEQAIGALSTAMTHRDPITAGHEQRVKNLSVAIALALGLDEHTIEGLALAAMVHDIGQIQIPAEILTRPRKLSKEEFDLVKMHAETGYEILKDIIFPWPIAEIVLQHHENIDGSGYPQGLTGEQIILSAKIIRVADSVEAMFSHRPFRRKQDLEYIMQELINAKGTKFDPLVTDICLQLLRTSGTQLFTAATQQSS